MQANTVQIVTIPMEQADAELFGSLKKLLDPRRLKGEKFSDAEAGRRIIRHLAKLCKIGK
jgi:hypothetical protein